jgi:PTH2 family peptidyl-tRNA hydrolase
MENYDYYEEAKGDYVKQVIVIRKDLKMRTGKLAAQAAHAAMKVILDHMTCEKYAEGSTFWNDCCVWYMRAVESEPLHRWLKGTFTKVVVYVNSEEELLELKHNAERAGILCSLVTDAGRTEFHGVRTNTAVAIGPDWTEKVDKITGHLPLL